MGDKEGNGQGAGEWSGFHEQYGDGPGTGYGNGFQLFPIIGGAGPGNVQGNITEEIAQIGDGNYD